MKGTLVFCLVSLLAVPVAVTAQETNSEASQALLDAAWDGDVDLVREALKNGADPKVADEEGNTPLIWLCDQTLFSDERSVVTELIAAGAEVDAKNEAGMTALMISARNNQEELITRLIEAKADLEVKDADGWTALMYAVHFKKLRSAEVLLAAKADLSAKDNEGWTPIMFAIESGAGGILEELVDAGAAVPNEIDGISPLFFAIRSADLTTFRIVLGSGADTGATTPDGATPLIFAAGGGREQIVMDLLRAGANPDAKDKEGRTAKDHAAENEYHEIVAILGGEWKKPELRGAAVSLDCQSLGGEVVSHISTDEGSLVVQTVFPKPVAWYIGGGMVNVADTSKMHTHKGSPAGQIYLDVDNDPKTGAQPDMFQKGRKGAEFTLDHDEYGTTVRDTYRGSDGEIRERSIHENVISVTVIEDTESIDFEVWVESYPFVFSDLGVLTTVVELEGLGLKTGDKITVATEFRDCVSEPTAVTLN